jgi:hypothetical protein
MSIEVAAQRFLFRPHIPLHSANFSEMLHEIQIEGQETANAMQNQPAEVPFSHNHLHDLESLWWAAVWIVFYNHFSKFQESDEGPLSDLQEVDRQLGLARTLFPPFMKSIDRQNSFQTHGSFQKVCKDLPPNKTAISAPLEVLRRSLVHHYNTVKSTLPKFINSAASKDDIFETFTEAFNFLRQPYSDVTLAYIPDIHTELRANVKRAQAELTNDAGVVTQKRK